MPQAKKIISKPLTDTDIKKRLSIPVKSLPDLPDFNGSHAVKFHLIYGTRPWPIVCSIRKKGHKKPVFSGGWRKFVISNNFNVGDQFMLYKVYDAEGASHYRLEVEKPARTSGDLSPPALSLNHDADEATGKSACTQALNFKHELRAADDDAPMKEEKGVVMELSDVTVGASVPFVDHAISKPSCWIFGTNLIEEATGKAHFKTEQETETKFSGIAKATFMGEQLFQSHFITKEEKDIKCAMAANASSLSLTAAEACNNGSFERSSLDLVLGQAVSYAEEMNLDLTLAPPIVD